MNPEETLEDDLCQSLVLRCWQGLQKKAACSRVKEQTAIGFIYLAQKNWECRLSNPGNINRDPNDKSTSLC